MNWLNILLIYPINYAKKPNNGFCVNQTHLDFRLLGWCQPNQRAAIEFRSISIDECNENKKKSLNIASFVPFFLCVEQKYVSLSNGRSKLFVGLCANQSRKSGRKKKYFELKWKRFAGCFRRYIPYLNYKFDHKVTNQSLEQQFFVRNFMLWMFSVTFFSLFLLVSLLGIFFFTTCTHHTIKCEAQNAI